MTTKLVNKSIGTSGFGLMGLTWRAKPQPQAASIDVMRKSLDLGANFWNGGTFYGTPEYNSLQLLNAYFTKYPEDSKKIVLSIKGGFNFATHGLDGSPAYLRQEVENALKLLDGKCGIDIYECSRTDPKVSIEETVGALAELVKEGKIGGVGLSECGAETIRRAAKVTTIASVEVEFSMFSPDILENGVSQACAELGIPIVAYSPLSRGFLTGQLKSFNNLPEVDMRRSFPRFQPENFDKNLELVHEAEKLAKQKNCTTGNIAIAWVKAYSGRPGMPVIIPIPGTTSEDRLVENMTDINLSEDDMKVLNAAVKKCEVVGGRYPAGLSALEWG